MVFIVNSFVYEGKLRLSSKTFRPDLVKKLLKMLRSNRILGRDGGVSSRWQVVESCWKLAYIRI